MNAPYSSQEIENIKATSWQKGLTVGLALGGIVTILSILLIVLSK